MAGLTARWLVTALSVLLLSPAVAEAPAWSVADTSLQAFSQPLGGDAGWQDEADRASFQRGRALFRRAWIVGPTQDRDGAGLGPLFNRLSCVACHPANGRGRAPDGPDERLQSMLVRLSVPGIGPHGAPRPHPAYGDQFNEKGVPGVAGEGRAALAWDDARIVVLEGGERVALRRPRLQLLEPAYGPIGSIQTSLRIGSPVYGLGLLEAVPEAELLAGARAFAHDGVRGRPNRVWDPVQRRHVLGRFGWKANAATLAAQVVQAAHGDLGLTSAALPQPACATRQAACRAAQAAAAELTPAALTDLTHYLRRIAPPAPRDVADPAVVRGRTLFASIGCVACHRPALRTGPLPFPPFAPQTLAAYTDLLLHDLGEDLADHRPDFAASGRQWRTPPLWGLGLLPRINEHTQLLHDGRARDAQEAVLWHGGEARRARERYVALPRDDRQAVLAFLSSL